MMTFKAFDRLGLATGWGLAGRIAVWLLALLWFSAAAWAGQPTVLSSLAASDRVTAPLVLGKDGQLYGTSSGGRHGKGTVFRLTGQGKRQVLHHFAGPDGEAPLGLVQATDGGLYGVTTRGGEFNDGTAYRIEPTGEFRTLQAFRRSVADGGWPRAALMASRDGSFYGSTSLGGPAGAGAIFRMSAEGQLTWLHWFDPALKEGSGPSGRLIEARDGLLYGTTVGGGKRGHGTVFSLRRTGELTTLHSFDFDGTDGYHPDIGVTEGPDGLLYGVAEGHRLNRRGLIYRLPPDGALEVIYNFPPPSEDNGREPLQALLLGRDGHLYGSTSMGGMGKLSGTLFRLAPDGRLTTLHAFGPDDPAGQRTSCGLMERADGEFLGATSAGGLVGGGSIFRLQTLQIEPL